MTHATSRGQFTEYEIIETMHQYGGGFVQALARCWRAADRQNQQRLYDAFGDVFDRYRDMKAEIERRRAVDGGNSNPSVAAPPSKP